MAHSERPALDRILRQPRMRETFELLTEELSGADLTSLLLEVFRRRLLISGIGLDRVAMSSPVALG